MQTSLNEFFGRDDVLRGSIIAFILYLVANILFKSMLGTYALVISDIVLILCVVFLLISFKNHNKNVQKALLGAVLMWFLNDQLVYISNNYLFTDNGFNISNMTMFIFEAITFVLYLVLFINYFIIISDHHSKPISIMINQILMILIAVNAIVQMVYKILINDIEPAALGEVITWNVAIIGLVAMIVSYETHFDIFKKNRELKAEENK